MKLLSNIAMAGLTVLLAGCTTTDTSERSSPRFSYLIAMEGERTLNKGQFELVFRDGSRQPLPADHMHTFEEADGNQYVFGSDKRIEKVCVGIDCGVFSPLPGRANSYVAVFPASFQQRRRRG